MSDDLSPNSPEFFESIQRLTKDLKNASVTLSEREVRFLVDSFYQMQKDRIRTAHQQRTLRENAEPHDVINWLSAQRSTLERQVAGALDAYSNSQPAGRWARSILGIGPIISAGLIAHIDISLAPTVGHIWRFAGLDPTVTWDKGEIRPWNASLKTLCWKIGESFTKVCNNDNDIYGHIYAERKQLETQRNEALQYADQAKVALAAKSYGSDTQARKHYEKGMLPPARIHLRSQRYATKRFLYDLFAVMYFIEFDTMPPKPWVITHGGHAHFVPPPNMHLVPGMEAAFARLPMV